MTNSIKQADREDRYTSEIIGGRYQVLESDVFRKSYFVYDLVKDDILRSRDNSCRYFDDLSEATSVAEGSALAVATKVRAKQLKVTGDQTAVKVVKEKPAATEPKAKRPSANSMMINLIKTTEMTDEEISVEVHKVFTEYKGAKPYDVKYARRLIAAGKL